MCSIKFHSNRATKKILKNQFPIRSSTLREYLINANNLSGIVRWSYLVCFFEMMFLSTALTTRTQRVHGSSSILLKLSSCIYICMFVCMYVPEIQPKRYTMAQNFFVPHYSPFSCSVHYQVLFKSGNEKNIKK